MKIDFLNSRPEFVPQIAEWYCQEWPSYFENGDRRVAESYCDSMMHDDHLPCAFVASEGNRLLGTIALIENDLSLRPNYNPWLASLYVADECRGQGIAGALVARLTSSAKEFRVPIIYVWSKDLGPMLRKRGWEFLERVEFLGAEVEVLRIVL